MEILIIANNDIGLFNFRKELIEALLSSHFVHIALPYGEKVEELKNIGCKYHEIEMDRRSTNVIHDFKLMMKIRKLIKEIDPDYVITYTIKPNVYGGMACRSLRVPYVANVTGLGTAFQRDGLLKRFVTFLYKVGLKDSRVVFLKIRRTDRFS